MFHDPACFIGHLFPASTFKVLSRLLIEGEDRGGRSHLCSHVTNSTLTCSGERCCPLAEIFNDGVGSPFHGQDTDRKSTRLNSSHVRSSYAVFCLKKKTHLHR